MKQSDSILVEKVLQGHRAAYGTLYDRYAPLIRAVCYETTADLTEAQDLAQEVFLRAYGQLECLRDRERFGAWLAGIARNICRDWVRERIRERTHPTERFQETAIEAGAEEEDSEVVRLRRVISELPARERLALQAFYLNGQSAEQSRKLLGLSLSGFYRMLERARDRVASIMLQEERVE